MGERIGLISILTSVLLSLNGGCCLWWQGSPSSDPNDPNDGLPNVTRPEPNMPCDANEYVIQRPISLVVFMKQGQRELFRSTIDIDPQDPLVADAQSARYYMVANPYSYYEGWSDTAVRLHVSMSPPAPRQSNFQFSFRATQQWDFEKKGHHPLFKLNDKEKVTVGIEQMRFVKGRAYQSVSVFMYPYGDTAAALSMLHYSQSSSSYYRLPGAIEISVGPGNASLQVPQICFLDLDPNYAFVGGSGCSPGALWQDIPSPLPSSQGGYPVLNVDGTPGTENGEVYELSVCAAAWGQRAP